MESFMDYLDKLQVYFLKLLLRNFFTSLTYYSKEKFKSLNLCLIANLTIYFQGWSAFGEIKIIKPS